MTATLLIVAMSVPVVLSLRTKVPLNENPVPLRGLPPPMVRVIFAAIPFELISRAPVAPKERKVVEPTITFKVAVALMAKPAGLTVRTKPPVRLTPVALPNVSEPFVTDICR